LTKYGEDPIAARTAEEIDLLDGDQPLPKNVEQPTEGWRPRAFQSPRAARSLQRLFDISRQLVVGVLSRSPELLYQRIVGPCIDIVGCEDSRLTAGRFDFGLQPLEIFT
jgi:hypothetical protein